MTDLPQTDSEVDDSSEQESGSLQDPSQPEVPLQSIALALSGGGFRAASFSLGALAYLRRILYKGKPLIENVKFITSTSGGSITNGAYTVHLYNSAGPVKKFQEFYDGLREQINGEHLLNTVFKILGDDKQWIEQGTFTDENGNRTTIKKQRNGINAFAKSYDQELFKGTTLGHIADNFKTREGGEDQPKPHLEEVCFNTTEFNNGLNFYFQVNGHTHTIRKLGNAYLKFSDTLTAGTLKLSDVVACSSCFPGGFEPFVYPTDFVHPGSTDVNKLYKAFTYGHNAMLDLPRVKEKPFSLMDGGMTDNMGLNSVIAADRMRKGADKKKQPFDLILACDVTSYFFDPLKQPTIVKNWFARHITLQHIINLFKYSSIILILSLAAIFLDKGRTAGLLLLLPSALFTGIYLLLVKLTKPKNKNNTGIVTTVLNNGGYFAKLPLSSLWPMITARLNSVMEMVGDLFLKQIRRGQYNYLFSIPQLKDRAIACLVYEFSSAHETRRLKNIREREMTWWPSMQGILMPSTEMRKIADSARSMGTTLWFSGNDVKKKDDLIASGQFTTCYSLIKHVKRLQVLKPELKNDPKLNELLEALLKDWDHFKATPFFMINRIDAP